MQLTYTITAENPNKIKHCTRNASRNPTWKIEFFFKKKKKREGNYKFRPPSQDGSKAIDGTGEGE